MLKKINVHMEMDRDSQITHSWAFYLYSALNEIISKSYADTLHQEGLKPVSQFLKLDRNEKSKFTWIVNLIGKEAIDNISNVIENTDKYYINKYQTEFRVKGIDSQEVITEKCILDKYLTENRFCRRMSIVFISPCSFKSNEQYVIIPTIELIIKSAIQKWNVFSKEAVIEDKEAIEQIISHTRIEDYNLRSIKYELKSVYIPSFTGKITLSNSGPEPMVRLFNLLLNYLQYSGLGIKSSLGMGGCEVYNL